MIPGLFMTMRQALSWWFQVQCIRFNGRLRRSHPASFTTNLAFHPYLIPWSFCTLVLYIYVHTLYDLTLSLVWWSTLRKEHYLKTPTRTLFFIFFLFHCFTHDSASRCSFTSSVGVASRRLNLFPQKLTAERLQDSSSLFRDWPAATRPSKWREQRATLRHVGDVPQP